MGLLDTRHKRKSMAITVILHLILLLLLLFVFGLKYMDPPLESGIAVNFGMMETGTGNIQPDQPVQSSPREVTPPPESKPVDELEEDVATQDIEEAPVIKNKEKKEQVKQAPAKEQIVKKPVPPEPKPDKATTDALSSLINAPRQDGQANGGEGNDKTGGDKGDPTGDPNASAYYGTGKGLDGDGNYQLGGRRALNKEKYLQDCNEAGVVVVSIEVDRLGKVISAVPGVKGTNNNSRCLLEPARRAALETRFNEDPDAPAKQIGKIIYRFRLSE